MSRRSCLPRLGGNVCHTLCAHVCALLLSGHGGGMRGSGYSAGIHTVCVTARSAGVDREGRGTGRDMFFALQEKVYSASDTTQLRRHEKRGPGRSRSVGVDGEGQGGREGGALGETCSLPCRKVYSESDTTQLRRHQKRGPGRWYLWPSTAHQIEPLPG
jgi:hypothetical protein